jgi:hypothetical protein
LRGPTFLSPQAREAALPYILFIVMKNGTEKRVPTEYETVEDAIRVAGEAIPYGITDAWIVDEYDNRCANFETIKVSYALTSMNVTKSSPSVGEQ